MNKRKLEVVKQEMARVNIDILGISELHGLEWVNLTQMTIGYTTVSKNPLAEMEQPSQSTKELYLDAVLGCNLKNDRMISVRFQGKPFNITVIQVYALSSNAEEAKVEQFCEEL